MVFKPNKIMAATDSILEEFFEYATQMKWLDKEDLDGSIDVYLEKLQKEVAKLDQDYDSACPCIANQSSYKSVLSSSESDDEEDQIVAAPVVKKRSRRSVCLRRLPSSSSSSDDFEDGQKEQSELSDDDNEEEAVTETPEQRAAQSEVNNVSSEDDNFNDFISKLKPTKKSTNLILSSDEEEGNDTDGFIDDDSVTEIRPQSNEQWFTPRENTAFLSSDEDELVQKSDTSTSRRKKQQSSSKKFLQTPVFKTPAVRKNKTVTPLKTPAFKTPAFKTPAFNTPASTRHSHCTPKILDQVTTPKTPSGSAAYKRQYKKLRDQTANELFELFNETVFENKLPKDTKIVFNKRMTKTAGFCYYYKNSVTKVKTAKVELAEKVCDTVERLRDTVIHELCHAAAWILNGVKCGHGTHWKMWADKAHKAHPDLPPISRCHQFDIECRFNYKCLNPYCARTYGRHSKSLKKCPDCFGSLQLLEKDGITPAKQRTPNKFALFVKEQYRAAKAENPEMVHADIMKSLGRKFSTLST